MEDSLFKELEEVKAKLKKIEKEIKEKEKNGKWKPEKGDIYWLFDGTGWIYHCEWDNDNVDRERYLIGNCYQTQEECEFTREKLKVIAELKQFEEPEDAVWDGNKAHYYIGWNCPACEVSINSTYIIKQNEIYFASKDDWTKAIKAVGKDRIRKYYLGM